MSALDRKRFEPGLISYYEDHAAADLFTLTGLFCRYRLPWCAPGVPDVVKYLGPLTLPTPFGVMYFLISLWVLARYRPDSVYLNNGPSPHLPMIAAARLFNIPIVAHLRALRELQARDRRVIPAIRMFFTLSEAGRKHYVNQGIDARRVRVVYDAVATDSWRTRDSAIDRALPAGPIYAVMVASLNANKRPLLALEALDLVRSECPMLRLVLVGDGPLRLSLEQSIRERDLSDRVWLLGYRDDVPALLRECHIGLLLSEREGWGNSVLEYMAARLPVIITSLPHVDELVVRDVTGIVLPEPAAPVLARALARLYLDADLRARMGEAGRQIIDSARFERQTMISAVSSGIVEAVTP